MDSKHPVLVDKYFRGKEIEVDAVSDGETVLIPGIMEHIERAGVHSGDSIAVYPSQSLADDTITKIIDYTVKIGQQLPIKGLMNIQMVVMQENNQSSVYILEVNPRSSRTIPFISKVTGVPMVRLAVRAMLGLTLKEQGYSTGLWKKQNLVGVKAPVFSMSKLAGVDTYLGPEMKSTGEVMGIDCTYEAALTKALIASGLMLTPSSGLLFSIANNDKAEAMPIIQGFYKLGCVLYATEGTAAAIEACNMKVQMIGKKLGKGHPNVIDIISNGSVNGVINTITGGRVSLQDGFEIRRTATERRIPCFTSLDTVQVALKALTSDYHVYNVRTVSEYLNGVKENK